MGNSTDNSPLKVACGIVVNVEHQILIAQRSHYGTHPGFWEFPGGKADGSESPKQAVIRELWEEVGIECDNAHFWCARCDKSTQRTLYLYFYIITQFTGSPHPRVDQPYLYWITSDQLREYHFPEGNASVVAQLQAMGIEQLLGRITIL